MAQHPLPGVTPPTGSTTLDRIAVIDAAGTGVPDTSVTFAASTGRTIVLRHASPDDAIFLILRVPPAPDSLHRTDSLHITLHPVAGAYEFSLTTPDSLPAGTGATFSYAIHFRTPAALATKYPSPGHLDLLLAPAEVTAGNKVVFVTATRPAADMLQFPVTHSGTWALAALR